MFSSTAKKSRREKQAMKPLLIPRRARAVSCLLVATTKKKSIDDDDRVLFSQQGHRTSSYILSICPVYCLSSSVDPLFRQILLFVTEEYQEYHQRPIEHVESHHDRTNESTG